MNLTQDVHIFDCEFMGTKVTHNLFLFYKFDFMNWQVHIVTNKEVLLGKPTIKGRGISVEHIISLLAQGWEEEKNLENYPRLTPEA